MTSREPVRGPGHVKSLENVTRGSLLHARASESLLFFLFFSVFYRIRLANKKQLSSVHTSRAVLLMLSLVILVHVMDTLPTPKPPDFPF